MTSFALPFALVTALALPVFAGGDHDHDHGHDHAHEEDHAEDHGHVHAEAEDGDMDAHLAEADGLRVLHPWAVPVEGGLHVYFEMENQRDVALVLNGGESHDGDDMVLMATVPGQKDVLDIGKIPVAPGSKMVFAPGGLYLWLQSAEDFAPGQHEEAHLDITPIGELDIEIEIYPSGTRQHPHAGHNH